MNWASLATSLDPSRFAVEVKSMDDQIIGTRIEATSLSRLAVFTGNFDSNQ
jgi:hypothetical protein